MLVRKAVQLMCECINSLFMIILSFHFSLKFASLLFFICWWAGVVKFEHNVLQFVVECLVLYMC